MANKHPNTKQAVKYNKEKSEFKKKAVLTVLKELELLDDPINNPIKKSEICRRAKVSKTFLYSHSEELLKPINEAISRQNNKIIVSKKEKFSESSKDRVIESLKRRIKLLEEENKKLKNDNSILLGKLAHK